MQGAVRIVVSGASAVGKSTVGRALAERLGVDFIDGDDLHPPANVAKMAAGVPLSDDDRRPWLDAIAAEVARSERIVIACSALKRAYRDRIRAGAPDVVFIQLVADRDTLLARASAREGHFMPAELVDSQLDALEPLLPDEAGFVVASKTAEPDATVAAAVAALSL
jgi:carbohydrate kinase (thermoresistant glucokinase family)